MNKSLFEKTRKRVKEAIDEVIKEALPNTIHQHVPSLLSLDINEMVKIFILYHFEFLKWRHVNGNAKIFFHKMP
jgi:hypothetical protein